MRQRTHVLVHAGSRGDAGVPRDEPTLDVKGETRSLWPLVGDVAPIRFIDVEVNKQKEKKTHKPFSSALDLELILPLFRRKHITDAAVGGFGSCPDAVQTFSPPSIDAFVGNQFLTLEQEA